MTVREQIVEARRAEAEKALRPSQEKSRRRVVFVNHGTETFTPTQSGALATIIWENCRASAERGDEPPLVITRTAPGVNAFPWRNLREIEYPWTPKRNGVGMFLCRAERKLTGWREIRQRSWAARVAGEIERSGAQQASLVLINEPEMAVYLRQRFPAARIVHWFQNQHECKARFRRAFAGSADAVIAVSDFTARWVEQYYGLSLGTVATVYNAVDSRHFTPDELTPPGPRVINFLGRTGIEKGPDLVLEAAIKLAERTREFKLQLVGSNHWDRFELDDYQRRLNGLVAKLESQEIKVRRPGHVGRAALPDELRQAHIHVMSSRWDEPFGMATLEGMACGLATVASRTGGTPEVVGNAAILFERDDTKGLTDALERFVRDEKYRTNYALRARQRAVEFTWRRCWDTLSKFL